MKVSPSRRQVDAFDPLDELLALEAVADQLGDGAHLQAVLLRRTASSSGRRAISPSSRQDFADDGRRLHAGQPGQIDRSFGLPGRAPARRHPAGPQRVDVARPQQILRLGILGDGHLHGGGRSLRQTPVVTPNCGWASTVTVNAVPSWAVFVPICGCSAARRTAPPSATGRQCPARR